MKGKSLISGLFISTLISTSFAFAIHKDKSLNSTSGKTEITTQIKTDKTKSKNVIKIGAVYYEPTNSCQIPDWIRLNPDGSWVIDTSKLAKEVYANLDNMTFKNSVSVGSAPVSFSTSNIINTIYNYAQQTVMNIISSIMPTITSPFQSVLPFDLTKQLTDLAKQVVNGFWCLLSRPKPWGFSFQIPNSISIRLPCGYVGTTLPTEKLIEFMNQIPNKGLDVVDRVGRCISSLGQSSYCKPIVHAWRSLTVEGNLALAGVGKEYADKSNQQISQETQKLVESSSGPDLVIHSNDDNVYYNPTPGKVRAGLIRKAGDVGGTIYQPGKEQAQNLPPSAKPYYNTLVDRQLARREVILSFQKILARERQRTAALLAELEGLIKSPTPMSVSPSLFLLQNYPAQFLGALVVKANNLPSPLQNLAKANADEVQNLALFMNRSTKAMQKIFAEKFKKSLTKNMEIALKGDLKTLEKELGVKIPKEMVFKCCCNPCPCVGSAKSAVDASITANTAQLEFVIKTSAFALAKTIVGVATVHGKLLSEEAYLIRKDIVNAIKEEGDKQMAVLAVLGKLIGQDNYLQTVEAEISLAMLKAIYGQMDLKNLKQFQNALQQIRGQY